MTKLLILFFLFFSFTAHANFLVNLNIIHKKGIDKGLILASELHTIEKGLPGERIVATTSSGLRFEVLLDWSLDRSAYGPSSELVFVLWIFDSKTMKVLHKFPEGRVNLEESRLLTFQKNDGELVEVSLKPKMMDTP